MSTDAAVDASSIYCPVTDPITNVDFVYAIPFPINSVHMANARSWSAWSAETELQRFTQMMMSFVLEAAADKSLGTPSITGKEIEYATQKADVRGILEYAGKLYRGERTMKAKYAEYFDNNRGPRAFFDPTTTAHICFSLGIRCHYQPSKLWEQIQRNRAADGTSSADGNGTSIFSAVQRSIIRQEDASEISACYTAPTNVIDRNMDDDIQDQQVANANADVNVNVEETFEFSEPGVLIERSAASSPGSLSEGDESTNPRSPSARAQSASSSSSSNGNGNGNSNGNSTTHDNSGRRRLVDAGNDNAIDIDTDIDIAMGGDMNRNADIGSASSHCNSTAAASSSTPSTSPPSSSPASPSVGRRLARSGSSSSTSPNPLLAMQAMDSCQANTGSDKLYKITLYVLRVLDINDRYLGCIVVLAQHDPLWNIGSTIYEHLVSVSGYREPTLRSSRKGKRGAPDSITGGPLTMSEIGPRAYCEMCAKYMGRSNSRDTTIDELSEYIDWANCPYHPVNVLTLENAVKQFRSLVDNPDELPLLKHEFITLQDVRSLLHFPAKQAWRVRSTAMDWGTFSSLFPWIENTDELNADIQKLLIMNSRGEGDREQRRRDPLEMISARAAMEQAHNTTQLARMNKMAPSLLRAANATTTTSTTTTSSKTKCPSEPAAALSWAVRKRSIFLEERAHKDKFTASAMEALTTIGQNTRWFPGLPRYLHPAMQWLRATSQSQSLCSVVNSNSTGDSSKRDLNMLLDKLVMRVNSKNAPLIRGLDEFASYVMYCFFGMPGKIGIPLHLSVGYMLATLGKYSAYRPDDMGTNILFVCGPDAGKSDILNHTLSSCMPDTASAEATRSLRADCSGENNNGLIEVSHDVKLEAWTGKLPEQKTKLTENQLDHKYLEVKEDGTRHTVKLVTRMRIACICATDMEFAIDKSIVTRVHLYFVPRVDINNSTNFKRKRDSKEEKMFNSIFQLQHCLYVLGTCYVQSTGNLVSTTLTELILDDFCRELKARRQVSVNMEARFRTRVRNSAYTSAILNANQIVFGKHGITGQLPTPDITIPEMRYIVPYAHDSLQIAICSISSVIEEICNPLNYYVLLALMAMAGFPALEYVTGKSTLASILRTNALNAANSAKEGAHRRVKWHRVAANEGLTSVGTVDKNAQYKIDPNFLHLDGDLQQLCPQIGAIMQQFLAPHVLFDGPVIYAILVGLQNIHVRINNYATLYDSAAKQLEPNSELQLVDNLTTTDVKCLQVVEKAAYKKPHVLISIEAINRICRLSDFTDYVTTRLPFAKVAPRRLFTMLMDYGRKTPPSTVATSSTITAATPGSYPLSMKNLIFIDFLADPSRQSITFNGAVPMAEELMLVDDDISADDSAAASTSSTSSSSSSAHADLDITASTNAAVTISEDYDHWVHFEHCRNNFISWDTAKRSWEYIQTLRKRTALSTTDIEAMQVAQTIAPLVSGSVIVNDSPGAAEEAPAATANQTDIDEVLHDEQ